MKKIDDVVIQQVRKKSKLFSKISNLNAGDEDMDLILRVIKAAYIIGCNNGAKTVKSKMKAANAAA